MIKSKLLLTLICSLVLLKLVPISHRYTPGIPNDEIPNDKIPNDGIPNYCIPKITFGIPKQTPGIPNCGTQNNGIPNNTYITHLSRYQNIITFLLNDFPVPTPSIGLYVDQGYCECKV